MKPGQAGGTASPEEALETRRNGARGPLPEDEDTPFEVRLRATLRGVALCG